jgi:hypothetical protein
VIEELRQHAERFAGSPDDELKYVPDEGSAQQRWCLEHGIRSGEAKSAVLDVIRTRDRHDVTIVGGIVVDPRAARSSISEAEVYSWGFDCAVQRFARFLMERRDRGDGGQNEVVMDTPPAEAARFHVLFRKAWQYGWRMRWPIQPLSALNVRSMLVSSVARYSPALWLPDHVGGSLANWIEIEQRVDRAEAGIGRVPHAEKVMGARRRAASIFPHIRRPVAGHGFGAWPADHLDNATLSAWVRRASSDGT